MFNKIKPLCIVKYSWKLLYLPRRGKEADICQKILNPVAKAVRSSCLFLRVIIML